jgi:hypothetical protein
MNEGTNTNLRGEVLAVCTSQRKGVRKRDVGQAELRPDWGIIGDAHAADWHRQVSLLAWESIEKMRAAGLNVGAGSFAGPATVSCPAKASLSASARAACCARATPSKFLTDAVRPNDGPTQKPVIARSERCLRATACPERSDRKAISTGNSILSGAANAMNGLATTRSYILSGVVRQPSSR